MRIDIVLPGLSGCFEVHCSLQPHGVEGAVTGTVSMNDGESLRPDWEGQVTQVRSL
jgi:hypothetical protein